MTIWATVRKAMVSIRVLVGIAQEPFRPRGPAAARRVSIRVLVGIAQEHFRNIFGILGKCWFQSVCWSE